MDPFIQAKISKTVSLLSEEWHDHDILEPIYPEDERYG